MSTDYRALIDKARDPDSDLESPRTWSSNSPTPSTPPSSSASTCSVVRWSRTPTSAASDEP